MAQTTVRTVSSELAEVARTQLGEDPSQLRSHLEVLRKWLDECQHLHGALDDQILVAFLRGCKFSLEKAKEKLTLFFWIRTVLTQVIQDRDPLEEHVLRLIRLGVGTPLPNTVAPTDPKIFVIRVGQFDYSKCTFPEVIKVGAMINDINTREDDQMVICGMSLIIDMAHVTAGHLLQFDVNFLKQVAILYQDASPLRMQGIHIINPPPGIHTAVGLFNSLLSQKNKDRRIFMHGSSLESLQKHFPSSVLPSEYGGTLKSIQFYVDEWETKLKDNRDYLLQMAKLEDCNAKERGSPALPSFSSSFLSAYGRNSSFGTDGSFRKLEID